MHRDLRRLGDVEREDLNFSRLRKIGDFRYILRGRVTFRYAYIEQYLHLYLNLRGVLLTKQ